MTAPKPDTNIVKHFVCVFMWALTLPVRVALAVIATGVLTGGLPVMLIVETRNWACKGDDFDASWLACYRLWWIDLVVKDDWSFLE
jgi:hypothetical protein